MTIDYAGLGIVLTAIFAGFAALISSLNGVKLSNVKGAQEEAAIKVQETHALVNGNLSIVRKQFWAACGFAVALVGYILWDNGKK